MMVSGEGLAPPGAGRWRMNLRTRLMLHLNGLLLVTVALIAGLTLFSTVHSLRARARRDALGTASLLASATCMAVRPGVDTHTATSKQTVQRLMHNAIDAGNLKGNLRHFGSQGLQGVESATFHEVPYLRMKEAIIHGLAQPVAAGPAAAHAGPEVHPEGTPAAPFRRQDAVAPPKTHPLKGDF